MIAITRNVFTEKVGSYDKREARKQKSTSYAVPCHTPLLYNSSSLTLLDTNRLRVHTITIRERNISRHKVHSTIGHRICMLHYQCDVLMARDLIGDHRRILTRLKFVGDVVASAIDREVWLVGGREDPGDVESVDVRGWRTAFGVIVDAPFCANW